MIQLAPVFVHSLYITPIYSSFCAETTVRITSRSLIAISRSVAG